MEFGVPSLRLSFYIIVSASAIDRYRDVHVKGSHDNALLFHVLESLCLSVALDTGFGWNGEHPWGLLTPQLFPSRCVAHLLTTSTPIAHPHAWVHQSSGLMGRRVC